MDRLVSRAQRDEPRDALGARLWLLRRLHAVKDCIPVCTVERLEEGSRTSVARECGGEVRGHTRGTCSVVGAIPPSVTLRALHFGETRRLHRPGGDQSLRLRAVDLRPRALRRAWREAPEPPSVVECALLPVDPPPRERTIERLRVRDRRRARPLLRDLHPQAAP